MKARVFTRTLPSLLTLLCVLLCCFSFSVTVRAESAKGVFTGSSFTYQYLYEEGRDSEWEHDLIFLAHLLLYKESGHPYLVDKDYKFARCTNPTAYVSSASKNCFDANLRRRVLAQINQLIPEIHDLSDSEIQFRMKEILTSIGNAYVDIQDTPSRYFPFLFVPMVAQGEWGYFNVLKLEEYPEALHARLLAINGHEVADIIRRFASLLPHQCACRFLP